MNLYQDYHIHSTFSDGENSIDEIAQYCVARNIYEIAMTDHVRKTLSYSFSDYLSAIDNAAKKHNIHILKGIETKILPNGDLDMPQDLKQEVDLIIGSIHGWPKEIPYQTAYELLAKTNCTIIGHVKYLDTTLIELFLEHGKILEINPQYLLRKESLQLIKNYPELKISLGSNAHKLSEIGQAQKYFKEFVKIFCYEEQIWKSIQIM